MAGLYLTGVSYWKSNTSLWPSPHTTTTLVAGMFTVPRSYFTSGRATVKGAARNLLRAAVAALFNEAKYGNLYPPYATKTSLIRAVNSALASHNATTMMTLANTLNKWNAGGFLNSQLPAL